MFENHLEKNLIINARKFSHHGRFKSDAVFTIINQALADKGYIKREKKTEHQVRPEGRSVLIELRPYKEKTQYVTFMIKIKVSVENIKDEVFGQDKWQVGDLRIVYDAWMMTDYQQRWGMRPFTYFLKGIFNKYVYTTPLEAGMVGELKSDTGYIYDAIRTLIRSYSKREETFPPEDDVMRQVEKEINDSNKS